MTRSRRAHRPDRLPSAARATVVAGVVLVVAGPLSGLLLDEHGGVTGMAEWVLRTVVVVAAVVFVAGGAVLSVRVRRRVRRRPLGWAAALVAFVAFAWLVAIPVGFGVYLTHLPSRAAIRDVDLGARKTAVTVAGADGVRLRGWYVPSRNRAAVVALHGTGSSRMGVVRHARLLARHGYGVLAVDLRGHGQSDGRSTSVPTKLDEDMASAVAWVARRADVDPERVGLVGVSLGGEVALRAAARLPAVRATVAEGLRGGVQDASKAGASPLELAQLGVLDAMSTLLTTETMGSDAELVERVAPRRLLLISAGRAIEADANRVFARRGGASAEHWNLPCAAHAVALKTDPAGYERRVVAFLDDALTGTGRG